MNALTRAIESSGGVGLLAQSIGVTQTVISNWRARGGSVPAIHCAAIERATNGAVTRKDLRPDDWGRIWPELVDAAPQPADAG